MAIPPKSRHPRGQYASVEDLCDPFETIDEPTPESPRRPSRTPSLATTQAVGTKPSSGRTPAGGYRPLYRAPHTTHAPDFDDADGVDASFDKEGGSSRRPRRHAVNLMDALEADGGKPAPRRKAEKEAEPAVRCPYAKGSEPASYGTSEKEAAPMSCRAPEKEAAPASCRTCEKEVESTSRRTCEKEVEPTACCTSEPRDVSVPRTAGPHLTVGRTAPVLPADTSASLDAFASTEAEFEIRAVHPSGEGETVAVELCVPADFAAAATGDGGTDAGRKNGLYTRRSKNSPRWNHGDAPVEPRSRSRSKPDLYADSVVSEAARTMAGGGVDGMHPGASEAGGAGASFVGSLAAHGGADPCGLSADAPAYGGRVPRPSTARQEGTPQSAYVRLKLYLLVEQYADLRPAPGLITEEEAETLVAAGKLCSAVRRGMRLLGYGDRSARRLAYQLTAKGVERETAEAAAAYLSEKGLIQEDFSARLRAEAGLRKLWGPRRIRDDLRAGGYTADAIEDAMDTLSDTDFEELCATAIRRKYRAEIADGDLVTDRAARQKLTAALMRLGYDGDVIRSALRTVLSESEKGLDV